MPATGSRTERATPADALPRIEKALVFCVSALKAFISFMIFRFAILSLLLAFNFSMCKKNPSAVEGAAQATTPQAAASPNAAASPKKIVKPVVDQTAQTLIFCYHRLV